MLRFIPHLKMYVSTTPTPPILELRAWVEISNQPEKILVEIWTVNGKDVTVKEVNTDNFFMIDRANVHSVHTASLTGEVIHFYGEPKPC